MNSSSHDAEDGAAASACPYCKSKIDAGATKCPECSADLAGAVPTHLGTCPHCGQDIAPDATRCRHCKRWVVEQPQAATLAAPFVPGGATLS